MPSTWRLDVPYGRTVAKGADVENTGIKKYALRDVISSGMACLSGNGPWSAIARSSGGLFEGELRKWVIENGNFASAKFDHGEKRRRK
jgi:hypothetical protein